MKRAERKEVVRKLNRAIEAGDFTTIEKLIDPGLIHQRAGLSSTLPILTKGSPKPANPAAAFRTATSAIKRAFSKWTAVEEQLLSEGDFVVSRQRMVGQLRGAKDQFEFPMVVIFKVVDGRVTDIWALGDELGFWKQLGLALPDPAPTLLKARGKR